jgi:DnaJ-class molecular chaperone
MGEHYVGLGSPVTTRGAGMTCPNCDGTGLIRDSAGEEVVCPVCEGTGLLVDEDV